MSEGTPTASTHNFLPPTRQPTVQEQQSAEAQQRAEPPYQHSPPTDPHKQFCQLIGIARPKDHHPKGHHPEDDDFFTPWTNTLFARVDKAYNRQHLEYRVTATFSSTLLLLQVFIGAIVTALGAANSPHIVIAVFGAVNTVIAGIITYLQGRGQPTRSRAFRDALQKCRDEIEDTEAAFLGVSRKVGGYGGDTDGTGVAGTSTAWTVTVRSEVERLTELYEQAQEDARRNYPDLWVKAGEGQVKSKSERLQIHQRAEQLAGRMNGNGNATPGSNIAGPGHTVFGGAASGAV